MKRTMTRARAIKQGTVDGIEDADMILAENGHEAALGCASWGEMARGVKLAEIMEIPLELEAVYYDAYDKAASARVKEIAGKPAVTVEAVEAVEVEGKAA